MIKMAKAAASIFSIKKTIKERVTEEKYAINK